MKPDTALLKDNKPFYHPDFSQDVHHEIEIVLKISKEGKHISEKFAANYFEEIALGIDFTARDIQTKHKEKGLPWELAKAFDGSAPMSNFVPKAQFANMYNIGFNLDVNGETKQQGNTRDLLFSFRTYNRLCFTIHHPKKGRPYIYRHPTGRCKSKSWRQTGRIFGG
jgi:acylpyruvate hydrolase